MTVGVLVRLAYVWAAWSCVYVVRVTGANFCTKRFPGDCLGRVGALTKRRGPPFNTVGAISFASPAFVDLDEDGDLDLVVGDGYGKLFYFERVSVDSFELRFTTNPFDGINVSAWAIPAFIDVDEDGDLDLVVGDRGEFSGRLVYFERLSVDSWAQRAGPGSNPFHAVNVFESAAPAFIDWDEDGDLDLVVGDGTGALSYFERVSVDSWAQRTGPGSNPFYAINVNVLAIPTFIDFDEDGDVDLVLGHAGALSYFERLSVDSLAQHVDTGNDPFVGVNVFGDDWAAPAFIDLDEDGDLDLVVGDVGGLLHYFERTSVDSLAQQTGLGSNPFDFINVGGYPFPAFIDLDEDGDLDLVVGDRSGRLSYFERLAADSLEQHSGPGSNPFDFVNVSGQGGNAYPAFIDLDEDGDLDLVVGDWSGRLSYFERVSVDSWAQRTGSGSNPLDFISVFKRAVPAFIDWDEDGDLDLVVGNGLGVLSYFERLSVDSWAQRAGSSNPFDSISVVGLTFPAFVDWDKDGDLDLVVGDSSGTLSYFERLSVDKLGEVSPGSSPFGGISVGFLSMAAPAFVDWNADGKTDLVLGTSDSLEFFARAVCTSGFRCAARGACNSITGTCTCLTGYLAPECASCAAGYHTARHGLAPRQCKPCPGSDIGAPCADRGACMDDAEAAIQAANISTSTSKLAIGDGTCTCSDIAFNGLDCSQGACPPGSEEVASVDGSPNFCSACRAGLYSDPTQNKTSCEACPAGRAAKAALGSDDCVACPFGTTTFAGDNKCSVDVTYVAIVLLCSLAQHLGLLPLLHNLKRCIRIVDVSQLGDKVAVTTFRPHGVMQLRYGSALFSKKPVPSNNPTSHACHQVGQLTKVSVHSTRTRRLDEKVFLARSLDPMRLELLTLDGEPMLSQVDSSMGSLMIAFPHNILCTSFATVPSYLFAAVFLPVPWVIFGVARMLGAFGVHSDPMWLQLLVVLGIAAVTLLDVAVTVFKRRHEASVSTPMQARINQFRDKLTSRNPNPRSCDRGPQRAVSVVMLTELLNAFSDFIQHRTAYYLDSNITKPVTSLHQLSYAELAGPKQVVYFVSHFWGTAFRHFVETIEHHANTFKGDSALDGLAYWICFMSNNQWRVKEELGHGDWHESSFYKALRSSSCQATCMVLDDKALPLTRSWCLFEVLQTFLLAEKEHRADFQGLVFCTKYGAVGSANDDDLYYDISIALSHRLASLDLADARASNQDDQNMITELVLKEGGMAQMNAFVRHNMLETLRKVRARFERHMDRCSVQLSHSEGGPDQGAVADAAGKVEVVV